MSFVSTGRTPDNLPLNFSSRTERTVLSICCCAASMVSWVGVGTSDLSVTGKGSAVGLLSAASSTVTAIGSD